MRKRRLVRHLIPVAVLAASLFAAVLVACGGGSSSPRDGASPGPRASATAEESPQPQGDGSPAAATTTPAQGSPIPSITPPAPNTGPEVIEVLTSYLVREGVDGERLDTSASADCPLEAGEATPAGDSRLFLGQFCVSVKEQGTERAVFLVELPASGEQWEVELRFADTVWRVAGVEKVAG